MSRPFGLRAPGASKVWAVRLGAVATTVLTAVLAGWVIPWVPVGMTEEDYNFSVRVAAVLAMASAATGFLTFFAIEQVGGGWEVVGLWHSPRGKREGPSNHQHLYDRLASECEAARLDRRRSLSLVLVRVQQGDGWSGPGGLDALQHMAEALGSTVRSSDVMDVVGDDEVAVLAIGADVKARDVICARFEPTLAVALLRWTGSGLSGGAPLVSLGASTLGPDGSEPAQLLAAARASLAPVIPGRKKAA